MSGSVRLHSRTGGSVARAKRVTDVCMETLEAIDPVPGLQVSSPCLQYHGSLV